MNHFWHDKRVLITGHTGFKGSWLSLWLTTLGARVTGLALEPEGALFMSLGLENEMRHLIGDIRNPGIVTKALEACDPEITFHMAAQSLVLRGYDQPIDTWATNVMGSLNMMEAIRALKGPRAVVMVTTDKVYANNEQALPFSENDPLGGHDPYSSSKAAMEIAIDSWRKSFLVNTDIRLASARAGNVIGGGDWAENRIFPDIARALADGTPIEVRNPDAVRPWQHVLEPLRGYMTLAERLWLSDAPDLRTAFNFGPHPEGMRSVRDVVNAALDVWDGSWKDTSTNTARYEAKVLKLATQKSEDLLDHRPVWNFEKSVKAAMEWYKAVADGSSPRDISLKQLQDYVTACD